MKTIKEIKDSRRVIIVKEAHDGFSGFISIRGWEGTVVASNGAGWDHVSVSPKKSNYTPTWDDMCAIKDLFFRDDEAVIQIHPKKSEYVNQKTNCLHLWRTNDREMDLPPSFMVGMKEGQTREEVMNEAKRYYEEHGYKW